MDTYLIYFLQTSIGLVLFYLLYLLLLKNETFYRTNRIYLIVGLLLAILLPLFPISYTSPTTLMNNSEFFSSSEYPILTDQAIETIEQDQTVFSQSLYQICLWFYVAGIVFFLLRLIWQTATIIRMIHGKDYIIINETKVIHLENVTPFSFFNVVFIDIQKYSERELSNIIAHEKVHIRERHWIDLLTIELLTVLFWVNPVVWLYEKSIKQNHEYLADQGVLLAGYNPGQYQALLINQLMGVKVLGIAHNLNFSLNKKRMEMMKKEKSPGASKMKLILVLPIIAVLVFAFAKKEYVMVDPENTNVLQSNIENAISLKDQIKVKGKVVDSRGNPMTGANVIVKGTSNGTVVDRQGAFELDVPKYDKPLTGKIDKDGHEEITNANSILISYIGYSTVEISFDSREDKKLHDIKLEESVYEIKLPEIGDDKIVEVPPPPPPVIKSKGETFTIVEDMPNYKNGGIYKLALDLKEQTAWVMEKTKDRGEAVVGFTIAANGDIVDPYIAKSSESKMLDASALKIMSKLNNWNPGVQRGKKVPVDLAVPVRFE